jgi:hypothetical protein
MPGQQHWSEASILYAGATGTKEFAQPTATKPLIKAILVLPLLLVATAAMITFIIACIYLWKKKTQNRASFFARAQST